LTTCCDAYLKLAGKSYTLTGMDLWGARCGFLHGYTPQSRVVRQGKARMLVYVDDASQPVMTDPSTPVVMVSLKALFRAFAEGVADTMKRINRDPRLAERVNPRLAMMFRAEPVPEHLRGL
jgi:hypothetical protein